MSAPEYVFLISALAGERRFASTVAKRLESLGALTHGDRRATDTRDLSRFNVDTKVRVQYCMYVCMYVCMYGRESVANRLIYRYYKDIIEGNFGTKSTLARAELTQRHIFRQL